MKRIREINIKKVLPRVILGVLMFAIVVIIAWPFVSPIHVTWSSLPYDYTIYGTYVEINSYNGGEETDVVIPDTICFRPVEVISDWEHGFYGGAFMESDITSVYIPDSVREIEPICFYKCLELKEVRLSANLKEIPPSAFSGCPLIERIVIPEGVEEISTCAFQRCTNLREVVLPQTLKRIGFAAFRSCEKLECINIPEGIEVIKSLAFWETPLNIAPLE